MKLLGKSGSTVALLLLCLSVSPLLAQQGQGAMQVNNEIVSRHVVLPAQVTPGTATRTAIQNGHIIELASTPLTTWNASFVSAGSTFNFNMVGTARSTGASTTVQAFIIPIKLVVSGQTFDPQTVLSNGKTVVNNTVASPVFATGVTFTSGGVSMGATQYVDAYQRANFWGTVSAHTGYHVLLGGPTIQPEVTLTVPKRSGTTGTPFGHTAAEVDINYFDAQIQTIMKNTAAIQPNTLPIFIIYDTYLTQNHSCCIGGYHSSFGLTSAPQSYAVF